MCEALGLDTSGREKGMLVGRILGGDSAGSVASAKKANGKNGTEVPFAEPAAPAGKLTLDQLEGYLWGAAGKLRGSHRRPLLALEQGPHFLPLPVSQLA